MKRILFSITLIIILSLLGCQDRNKVNLRQQIHLADFDCPINLGIAGDLISIKYNEKDNMVLLYYSLNEEFAGPGFFKGKKEQLLRQFRLSLTNEESRKLVTDIVNARGSLTAVYKSNSTGKTRSLSLPYEELKEIKDSPLSERDINLMLINTMIDVQNSACPVTEEEGIVRTKVELVDNNIVIYYEMDENIFDIPSIKRNKNDIKHLIVDNLRRNSKDISVANDINRMIYLNMGYHYRFYTNKSKEFVDVIISPEDLDELRTY